MSGTATTFQLLFKMQIELLKNYFSWTHHGLNVPTLKQLSLESTAFWAVSTLHTLYDSPRKLYTSCDEVMKATKETITNKIPGNPGSIQLRKNECLLEKS